MAMTEDTLAGAFNGTSYVTIVPGEAGKRKIVKQVVVCNKDNVNHIVLIELVKSSVAYRMFKLTLAPDDTLVQDILIVCKDQTYSLRAKLLEAATTQPDFVATLAEIT